MPANRAILVDIVEMKLDPTVHHRVTRTAGRLASMAPRCDEAVTPPPPDCLPVEPERVLEPVVLTEVEVVSIEQPQVVLSKQPKSPKQPKTGKKPSSVKKAVDDGSGVSDPVTG